MATYDDFAAFSVAAGLTQIETFDAVVGEPDFRTSPVVVGDLTLQGYGGAAQINRNFIDQPPALFSTVNGTPQITAFVTTVAAFEITFASPIKAFGASFTNMNDATATTLITVDGETFAPTLATTGVPRFFGFVSDAAFTTVRFSGAANDGFAMDDIRYGAGQTGAVPEPATWALLIGGFGLAGSALRRRRTAMV